MDLTSIRLAAEHESEAMEEVKVVILNLKLRRQGFVKNKYRARDRRVGICQTAVLCLLQ